MSRFGNFTSSSIWNLMTNDKSGKRFGKPALTYIAEKRLEIRLGRNLQKEQGGRPTSWGSFIEERVFDMLPLDYKYQSDKRYSHPTLEHWTGAPDMLTAIKVCDIKCPYSIKEFCEKSDIMLAADPELLKKERPAEFWQLVSNAILTERSVAELIIYCPYQSELSDIKEMANNYMGDQNKISWLNWVEDEELPYLIDGNHYQNLCSFEFEVLDKYVSELTNRVKMAIDLL